MASIRKIALTGATGIVLGVAGMAGAQEVPDLPQVVIWSAYDTGSSGHAQAVAIGSALKNQTGSDLRILPGRNDISRMVPLRDGRAQFSSAGIAAYYAQEGVDVFLTPEWGPQPIRVLLASNPDHNQGLGASEESGITSLEEIRGRRVAAVVGSPAINNGTEAILAHAGLTWDDVERIDFPGYGAAWEGMLNGQADVAWGATTLGAAYQLANSPRGLHWLTVPHDDEAGWERLNAIAPHIFRHVATEGANISADTPHEGTNYPYPILITMADQDQELVAGMTQAMITLFPDYEGAAPGINGWALDRQNTQWILPFHDGAIEVLRGMDAWSDEDQAHNDRLVARQEALRAAWDELMAENLSGDALAEAWEEVRAGIDG
mgnify:CR=1 FL=1